MDDEFFKRLMRAAEEIAGLPCGVTHIAAGGWDTQRESTIYFDKLWLSEIGIKY